MVRPPMARTAPEFELYHGWELLSETYEATIRRYAGAMPAVCRAGVSRADDTQLFAAEPLLRHCAECLLYSVVIATPFTAKFDQQVANSLLYGCLYPYRSAPQATVTLEDYTHWLAWRANLRRAHADAGFTLCRYCDTAKERRWASLWGRS